MRKARQSHQIDLTSVWHAYVIRAYAGCPWDVNTMTDKVPYEMIGRYLRAAYGDDIWRKKKILDFIRNISREAGRNLAREHLPSLFKKRCRYPLLIPTEETEVDEQSLEIARNFRAEYIESRRHVPEEGGEMGEKPTTVIAGVDLNVDITVTRIDNGVVVPVVVRASDLTLDNFQERTGKRFRMTRAQVAQFGEGNRQPAFEQFLATYVANATRA